MRAFPLFVILILSICCNQKANSAGNTDPCEEGRREWKEVAVGFAVDSLGKQDDHILLIGEDSIGSLSSEGHIQRLPAYNLLNEFKTKDGGQTLVRMPKQTRYAGDTRSFPYVCQPKSSASLKESLLVVAECEHGNQIWNVNFSTGSTNLNVVNFDYDDSGYDNYGMDLAVSSDGHFLIPSLREGHPVLLTMESGKNSLDIVWQGKTSRAAISGIDMVNGTGLMILIDGTLLRSDDKGKTWTAISKLDIGVDATILDLKVQDELRACLLTTKAIWNTSDGGKTWRPVSTISEDGLKEIVMIRNRMTAIGNQKRFVLQDDGRWVSREMCFGAKIDDAQVLDNVLYVVSEGRLYSRAVTD